MNNNTTLGEQAYQALKEKIATLSSGTYLSARQFANDIGMSYTPVREAFLRLQREGSLKQIPNVGFFVETMNLMDMIQSFQVRECIEPFVLEKVYTRIEPSHIQKIRELIDAQNEALKNENIMEYMRLDIDIHAVFLTLYGNPHLLQFYRSIREKHMFCSNQIARAFYHGAVSEHMEFTDSLEKRDLSLSLQLLSDHIENAKQRMKEGYTNVVD